MRNADFALHNSRNVLSAELALTRHLLFATYAVMVVRDLKFHDGVIVADDLVTKPNIVLLTVFTDNNH